MSLYTYLSPSHNIIKWSRLIFTLTCTILNCLIWCNHQIDNYVTSILTLTCPVKIINVTYIYFSYIMCPLDGKRTYSMWSGWASYSQSDGSSNPQVFVLNETRANDMVSGQRPLLVLRINRSYSRIKYPRFPTNPNLLIITECLLKRQLSYTYRKKIMQCCKVLNYRHCLSDW